MSYMYDRRGYVASPDQLMTVFECTLRGGFREGVRLTEVHSGGNLCAAVVPDRCMDIYQVRYKGQNLNYIGNGGIVGPSFYDAKANRWLRSFFAGMLTTMGLQNAGRAYVDASGDERGQHGRIANTPAENTAVERIVEDGVPRVILTGTMREASLGKGNFTLTRTMAFTYGKDTIEIADVIQNDDFEERQYAYGLHLNYGYPLLEEGTKLLFDAEESKPLDEASAPHFGEIHRMEAPAAEGEKNLEFLHLLKKDAKGKCSYTVFNEKRAIGLKVTYDGNDFPYLNEWKYLAKGDYVAALEPMTLDMDGPKLGQPGCKAPVLKPGEKKEYRYTLECIDRLKTDA